MPRSDEVRQVLAADQVIFLVWLNSSDTVLLYIPVTCQVSVLHRHWQIYSSHLGSSPNLAQALHM